MTDQEKQFSCKHCLRTGDVHWLLTHSCKSGEPNWLLERMWQMIAAFGRSRKSPS